MKESSLGRVHSKKKIIVNFHNWRGGGQDKFFLFSQLFFIFFNVLIHANMQRKKFSVWGGGTPLPESPKILDMLGKNLEIFLSFMDL